MLFEVVAGIVSVIALMMIAVSLVGLLVSLIMGVMGIIRATRSRPSGRQVYRIGYIAWLLGPVGMPAGLMLVSLLIVIDSGEAAVNALWLTSSIAVTNVVILGLSYTWVHNRLSGFPERQDLPSDIRFFLPVLLLSPVSFFSAPLWSLMLYSSIYSE